MKTPQIPPLAGMSPLGLPVTERDTLAGADVDQALVPGVEPVTESARQIAELLAKRRPPAGFGKLYEGGLFDDVARRQRDLFG